MIIVVAECDTGKLDVVCIHNFHVYIGVVLKVIFTPVDHLITKQGDSNSNHPKPEPSENQIAMYERYNDLI